MLDAERFQVTTTEGEVRGQGALDSLATAGGHDIVVLAQAPMRRDSTFSGLLQLRDLTAHASYANNAASRRITRDSMRIGIDSTAANAVRRLTTMDRAPRVGVTDPDVRAFEERAQNLGPPRRLAIWNHPPHDNLQVQEAGSLVMDALRAAVRGLPRFVVVPRDSTLELLARSRNRETVLGALKAELMVSIAASSSSAAVDSVSWVITVRDVGAAQPYLERSFRSASAPLARPLDFTAVALSRVMAALEQMDAAPRRRPASP